MAYNIMFKKPNGNIVKMHGCPKVEFIFNGAIVKVTDKYGDALFMSSTNCIIYEGSADDEAADDGKDHETRTEEI